MKGLMLKDIQNFINQQGKMFLILMILYFFMALQMHNSSFFAGIWMILGVNLPISSLAYDEKAKWDKYALTMPISRKDLVLSKYLLSLVFIIIGNMISVPFIYFIEKSINMEVVAMYGVIIGVGILYSSLLLPFVFRFGVENARVIIIVIIAIPFVAWFLLEKTNINLIPILEHNIKMLIIFGVAATIIIAILSCLISIKIVQNKEIS